MPMIEVINMDVKLPNRAGEKIHNLIVTAVHTVEVGIMVDMSAKDATVTIHLLMIKATNMDVRHQKDAIPKMVRDIDIIEATKEVGMMEVESANAILVVKVIDIN